MIAVFGGSGRLGRPLVELLVSRGLPVRVVGRHPRGEHRYERGVEFVAADVREPRSLAPALAGADVVVSAVTGFGGRAAGGAPAVDWRGNVNLVHAAEEAGVARFVLLSAMHASADHPIELFRMKHRAETALRASRMEWTVLRPSAYAELWLDMLGRPLLERGRTRVFGRGTNPINFVSVQDVARFVELAIADPSLRGRIVELPGPKNLSFDELLAPIQATVGGHVDHVRPEMLRVMALAVRPFSRVLAAQISTAIAMDERDMTADPIVRAEFPVACTSVEEVARSMFGSARLDPGVRAA